MKVWNRFAWLLLIACLLLGGCTVKKSVPELYHDGRWLSKELRLYISFEWEDIELGQEYPNDPSKYCSFYVDLYTNERIRCDFVHRTPSADVSIICTEFSHEKYEYGYVFFEGELVRVDEDSFTVRENATGSLYQFEPWDRDKVA